MNGIIIGYGEIGKGLMGYYSKYHNLDYIDKAIEFKPKYKDYEVMLVSIPYSENFVDIVTEYQKRFNPAVTIIFSTVAIGVTSMISNAVHVPIEGKHPNLSDSIKLWQVFIGGNNNTATKFFIDSDKVPHIMDKPEFTEFLKLQSTTNYGLMIEYARYLNNICKDIGMDYKNINIFNLAYNNLYKQMGKNNYKRYLLDPPTGEKGGHCVTNNAKILRKQYPNIMIDIVAEV
jgi:UDP-glucose 6-dehydrogenase